MRPSRADIEEAFGRFNSLIFDNRLPVPSFRISHSRRTEGTFRAAASRRHSHFAPRRVSYEIAVSDHFELDRAEFEDVVIHEMIHLHIHVSGLRDSSPHGPRFRKIMNGINDGFGRHITVTSSRLRNADADTLLTRAKTRDVSFMLLDMADGATRICVFSPAYRDMLLRAFAGHGPVSSIRLFRSHTPLLSGYPSVRTPKMFSIRPDILHSLLTQSETHEIPVPAYARK